MGQATFVHFDPDLADFLTELAFNNNREWFNAHKARYEASVREPARALVRALAPGLDSISPHFVADDRKVGGALIRIYRDTRFSKDKTPYKTNVGLHFRHAAGKDVHAPGLYVHIEAESLWLGVGLWRPDREALAAIRERIAENPDGWRTVIEDPALCAHFEQQGDALKRAPRGFSPDHPAIDQLKRKDFTAGATLDPELLYSPGLVDLIIETFTEAGPFLAWLCEAVGQPF